jgi:Replication protein
VGWSKASERNRMKTNTAKKIEVARTTKDVVYRRVAQAKKLIVRLIAVGLAFNVLRVIGVAFLMSQCSCKKNVWFGKDLHNKDGELFDGKGTLTGCGNRLCAFCAADIRRRARMQARKAVSRIKANAIEIELRMRKKLRKIALASRLEKRKEIEKRLQKEYLDLRWRFVTLTAPKVAGKTLLEIIGVYNRAFELLRKRDFFDSWVAGGIKGVEFTVGEEIEVLGVDTETDPYHVHIHLMIYAEWLPWKQLQEEWTACIAKAWKEVGHELEIKTPSGNVLTRISLVVPKARKGKKGIMSEEAAIEEVVKYVTKTDSWMKIPEKHLVECATVKRWPRMFEVFGCARDKKEKKEVVEESATILDTPNINSGEGEKGENLNDAEPKKKPRAKPMLEWLEYMPFEIWMDKVDKKLERRREYRKRMLEERYPGARFMTLDGELFGLNEEISEITDE